MVWQETAIRLAVAFILGFIIGIERQLHHRTAGLRTNILVAVGSAGFTIFGDIFIDGESVPRIVAQIVSGIGFLGAGAIMREGLTVQGLNTAATIWCSSALGIFCGVGYWTHASIFAAFIVGINTVLRRLELHMEKYHTPMHIDASVVYAIEIDCKVSDENKVRRSIVDRLRKRKVSLKSIEIKSRQNGSLTLRVVTKGSSSAKTHLHQVMEDLAAAAHVLATRWDETVQKSNP